MRFFAHDGKSTHGPAGIEELLKLPGFDGDTLVCPVGSDDSSDWKPALAYPPFKKALLEAVPAPAPALAPAPQLNRLPPMPEIPALAPAPFEPPKTDLPIPSPFPLPAAPPPPMPAPAAAAPAPAAQILKLCPRCKHGNLEEAQFCNACGARIDGQLEDLSPAPDPFASSAPSAFDRPSPAAPTGFEHLDPMLSYPPEPAPAPAPAIESPRRPLQPGKMGQLADLEEPAPYVAPEPAPSPALAPNPEPAAAAPVWKRPAVIAAFVGSAVVAAGLGFMMLKPAAPAPAPVVAELAPALEEAPPPAPIAPAPVLYSTPRETSSPSIPSPRAPRSRRAQQVAPAPPAEAAAPTAKRARRPRKPRAPLPASEAPVAEPGGGDTMIESRAEAEPAPKRKGKRAAKAAKAANQGEKDPLLEALLSDATQPAPDSAAEALASPGDKAPPSIGQRPSAKPGQFSMPGLERKVSASDRARAPSAPAAEAPGGGAPPADGGSLGEPGRAAPPPGIEDMPAKSAEGDQLALVQVHEQFDFCTQLLSQGAYGDHYDTCLCKDAREAAPYRGRRGFYVTAKKKDAAGGRLESSAKITSSKIDAGVALLTAKWKGGASTTQTWQLEDGLWCQAR